MPMPMFTALERVGTGPRIFAIDPGPELSASCTLADGLPSFPQKGPNANLLKHLHDFYLDETPTLLAVEMIASYGMAVGREVFETCMWIGRFVEAWESRGGTTRLVYRRDVKLFLCQSVRATDSNIRAALLDRYGGKAKAIGTKAARGPLFGLKQDMWSALAVALTAEEQIRVGTL
jgi:hypothetical protein